MSRSQNTLQGLVAEMWIFGLKSPFKRNLTERERDFRMNVVERTSVSLVGWKTRWKTQEKGVKTEREGSGGEEEGGSGR